MGNKILMDSNGKVILYQGYPVFLKEYLQFNSSTANIIERCTYTTLYNGVTVNAAGSYARASFYFPVTNGKRYKLEFDSKVVDGYKMVYISNKTYVSGEGWSGTYTTMSVSTDGHKTYTFTASSDVLWLGFYVTANTSVGTMTITNAEINEV